MKLALISLALLCAATQLVSHTTETDAITVPFGSNLTTSLLRDVRLLTSGFVKVLVLFFNLTRTPKFICEGTKLGRTVVIVDKNCFTLISAGGRNIRATVGVDIAEAGGGIGGYNVLATAGAIAPCTQSILAVQLDMGINDTKTEFPFRRAILPGQSCAACQPLSSLVLTIHHSILPECDCLAGNHQQLNITRLLGTVTVSCPQASAMSLPTVLCRFCVRFSSRIYHSDASFPLLLGIPVSSIRQEVTVGSTCTIMTQMFPFFDFTNPTVRNIIEELVHRFGDTVLFTDTVF